MTDYIKMAREAGYRFADDNDDRLVNHGTWQRNQLERFAQAVRAAALEEAAVKADSMNTFGLPPDIGAAIRALKETP